VINRLRTFLKVIEWIVALLIAIVAAFSQASPSKWSEPFAAHVKFLVEWSIPLLVGLAFSTFFLKVLTEIVDRYVTNKDGIQKTLDELQKAFFQGLAPEDLYKHRVTLFKACCNPLTRARFLKIYARSGTSYQKVKVRFTIDDEGVEKNEGVAGRAYFTNGMLVVLGLPEWPTPGDANHPVCKEYCQKGYVTWQKARELDVQSRSIAAVVVRNKAGERWGVLVLDSRDPQGVSLSASKRAMMTLIGQILTNHV
jgi:hypothetical protein